LAKKRPSSRAKNTNRSRRKIFTGGRKKLGINLEPIVNVLNSGIRRLERQLPAFAYDPKKTKALQRSIATLEAVRDRTSAICPTEELWYGVPVRNRKRSRE
jgi:hypothetical protein